MIGSTFKFQQVQDRLNYSCENEAFCSDADVVFWGTMWPKEYPIFEDIGKRLEDGLRNYPPETLYQIYLAPLKGFAVLEGTLPVSVVFVSTVDGINYSVKGRDNYEIIRKVNSFLNFITWGRNLFMEENHEQFGI
jgi:hypothetical protein